jgi:hypothetical protein
MKRVATRTTVIQVLCALALLLPAQPAWSAPKVPTGEPFTLSFGAGEVCDFAIVITGTSAQAARVTLPSGEIVITGPAVATVRNVVTGESVTFNISGPSLFDPQTRRLTLMGTNLIIGPSGSSGGDTGFLIFTSGKVSFIVDQPIDEPLRGTVHQDVCAELA